MSGNEEEEVVVCVTHSVILVLLLAGPSLPISAIFPFTI